jgi:hypothetical protein
MQATRCRECWITEAIRVDKRGRYLVPADRSNATKQGNRTKRQREAASIDARFKAAQLKIRLARKVAA